MGGGNYSTELVQCDDAGWLALAWLPWFPPRRYSPFALQAVWRLRHPLPSSSCRWVYLYFQWCPTPKRCSVVPIDLQNMAILSLQGCALEEPVGSWRLTFALEQPGNLSFYHRNHMLGTLYLTGSEHWAPLNFSCSTALFCCWSWVDVLSNWP